MTEPYGTHMYIAMTKMAMAEHMTVSGTRTEASVMSMRWRLALPDSVAVALASSTYFCTKNMTNVMESSTTAMAAAPFLS